MTENLAGLRGGAPKRLMVARRRPVVPALAAISALLVGPTMIGAGASTDDFTGARLTADGLLAPEPVRAPAIEVQAEGLPPRMAQVEGIELLVPAHDIVMVGYHEASYDDALRFAPVGRLAENENSTKFTAGVDDLSGLDYTVLSSRGRSQGATTAIDVVLAPGVNVIAPVSGTVTSVRPYELYGRHADTRIEIQPDGAPLLRVVLIHVAGVQVAEGDRVEAGRSVLAQEAAIFPFSSQVDRYTEPLRYGHVHIEIKPPGGAIVD